MAENENGTEINLIPVRLVEKRGESVVVERGDLQRVILPLACLRDGQVSAEDWEMGIPYGLPWETIITLSATPQALADQLRKNGIYTYADISQNPNAVIGCLQAVYGVDLAALILAARAYKP